jgi:hypothetical protein
VPELLPGSVSLALEDAMRRRAAMRTRMLSA